LGGLLVAILEGLLLLMLMPDIQNRHVGDTAWVFGSGATMNYLEPSFFDDKLVVSANGGAHYFGVKPAYTFTHHHDFASIPKLAVEHPETVFVVNRQDYHTKATYNGDFENVVVHDPKTQQNSHEAFNPFEHDRPAHAHQLVFGSSSIHGAMHLAAYLGAKNIVLVGVDCGVLDDVVNFDGYPHPTQRPFAVWNRHLALMRDWLRDTYGVNTYSLNPFVNLHLEGHTFGGI
jgi:hypothetical protein